MAAIRLASLVIRAAAAFVVVTVAAAVLLSLMISNTPVPVHVRWTRATTDTDRVALEQRYHLMNGEITEGTTRAYRLADTSTENIRALVQDPHVDDTADVNRVRFRPRFSNDRQRRIIYYSPVAGVIAALAAAYFSMKAGFTAA